VTDSGSGAHHLDVASVCLPDVPLIVAMGHGAFSNIADDLDIFVVMEAKSRVGSDLIVVEHDEIPDRFVGRIAAGSYGKVVFCFKPACIEAADILE
jgi:hypothetical protein